MRVLVFRIGRAKNSCLSIPLLTSCLQKGLQHEPATHGMQQDSVTMHAGADGG